MLKRMSRRSNRGAQPRVDCAHGHYQTLVSIVPALIATVALLLPVFTFGLLTGALFSGHADDAANDADRCCRARIETASAAATATVTASAKALTAAAAIDTRTAAATATIDDRATPAATSDARATAARPERLV